MGSPTRLAVRGITDAGWAALAAAAAGVLVGSSMVATRMVIHETTPAALALLRYVLALATLAVPVLLRPRVRFRPRDRLPIALLGIGQFGVLIALLNYGLARVPAGLGALLFAALPLLTLLIGAGLRLEALTPAKALGVLLSIAGVALALGGPWQGARDWLGVAAVLGSALTGALCSVLYRPYLRRYPALPVSAYAMFAAVLFLAVLAAGEGFFAAPPVHSVVGWLAIGYIGLGSGVGYFLWLWALAHTTPTRVTVFLALSPVTAALLGGMLLDEPLTAGLLAGLACVVAGLWLAQR
jgi:drug/metabolite transporter (DMT)-like permease